MFHDFKALTAAAKWHFYHTAVFLKWDIKLKLKKKTKKTSLVLGKNKKF